MNADIAPDLTQLSVAQLAQLLDDAKAGATEGDRKRFGQIRRELGLRYAERQVAVWVDGTGAFKVIEYAAEHGETPPDWSPYRAQVQADVANTPRGPMTAERTVSIPAATPLLALRWLADNVDRLCEELREEGLRKINRIQAPPPGARFKGM